MILRDLLLPAISALLRKRHARSLNSPSSTLAADLVHSPTSPGPRSDPCLSKRETWAKGITDFGKSPAAGRPVFALPTAGRFRKEPVLVRHSLPARLCASLRPPSASPVK